MKDLSVIDGVKVIERSQATMDETNAPNPMAVGKPVKTVDEVLLEDGRVVFQCRHPRDEDCAYWRDRLKSVTAHQVVHGPKNRAIRAERELAESRTRAEQERRNRSNGQRRRLDRGEDRVRRRISTPLPVPTEITQAAANGNTDLERAAKAVIIAYNAMTEAQRELERVFIGYMRLSATGVDSEVAAKAEKWDKYVEFQKLINN